MKKKKKIATGQIVLNAFFVLMSACYVLPFLMVISVSFTDEKALLRQGTHLIPAQFSTKAYEMAFSNPVQIINSYRTTIIFTVVATALSILVMAMMAYPLSRRTYKYRKIASFYCLFVMLFSAGLVPSYMLITKYLHLNNTIWVYILPGLISVYNLLVIRTGYQGLPEELTEAAKIDGASEFFICFKIMMPLNKPVLASVGFLFFVTKWNDWNTSMLYIRKPELYSLQYMLQKILQEAEFLRQMAEEGLLMGNEVMPEESLRYALAIVAAGPVLVIFPFFQKYFTKGLTIGGVKG